MVDPGLPDQATDGDDRIRQVVTIVQRTVEGVALHLRDHPDADLSGHARKLVHFFDAALTGGSQ